AVGVGSFDEFGDLAGGGEQVGAVTGARHRDVNRFAVEAGGSDEDHAVAGEALGLVDRGRVAVVDVARLDVGGGDPQTASVGEREVDAAVAADPADDADHPV